MYSEADWGGGMGGTGAILTILNHLLRHIEVFMVDSYQRACEHAAFGLVDWDQGSGLSSFSEFR